MFICVKRLFRAAWDSEIDRNLSALHLLDELCDRGHRWSMFMVSGTSPDEWPCRQCQDAAQAAWVAA